MGDEDLDLLRYISYILQRKNFVNKGPYHCHLLLSNIPLKIPNEKFSGNLFESLG